MNIRRVPAPVIDRDIYVGFMVLDENFDPRNL
jgi:hypothetical protein